MATFQIYSSAGVDMGTYEGETENQAYAAMCRDAGYDVTTDEDDDLVFGDASTEELCTKSVKIRRVA